MSIETLVALITTQNIIPFIFKPLAIFIAVFYVLYAIVIAKQTHVMNKTLIVEGKAFISVVSSLQIVGAFALLLFAIFIL